jgi:hypothetical protein
MLRYIDHQSQRDAIDLTIAVGPTGVTVKEGSCVISGATCTIAPDMTFAVVNSGEPAGITCFLTLDPSTPTNPQVVFTDGSGTPPPNLYYRLLSFTVPPNTTDATALDIVVHRTRAPVAPGPDPS